MSAAKAVVGRVWAGFVAPGTLSGVIFVVAAVVIALVFALPVHWSASSTIVVAQPGELFSLPNITLPTRSTVLALAASCVAIGAFMSLRVRPRTHTVTVLVALSLVMLAMLVWAASGRSLQLVDTLQLAFVSATPLILGSLGGVVSERAGAINVGIEGMMLFGAFTGAIGASLAGPTVGILAAVVTGSLLGWLLGIGTIRFGINQIIAGIVMNIALLGVTDFFYNSVLVQYANLNTFTPVGAINIPGLDDLPLIGPVLFEQRIFFYVGVVLALVLYVAFRRSRWGLRVHAVGENPHAADAAGIGVLRTRYQNMAMSGAICGFAGAYLSIGLIGSFTLDMTDGIGYIALAVMIIGGWRPLGALAAAALFGVFESLQGAFATIGVPVASEFLQMAPYVGTIVVVAGVVGTSRMPAADGQPFIKS